VKPDTTIVKTKYGRVVEIQPQVLIWRRRMERYKRCKAEIAQILDNKGWDSAQIRAWLSSPIRALSNRTPKQLLNPRSIARLHSWVKKVLA
jgi:hypothetical protein